MDNVDVSALRAGRRSESEGDGLLSNAFTLILYSDVSHRASLPRPSAIFVLNEAKGNVRKGVFRNMNKLNSVEGSNSRSF